jgi:hypothetical protein
VLPPDQLPAEVRAAILADARTRGIGLKMKVTRLKKSEEEEEY